MRTILGWRNLASSTDNADTFTKPHLNYNLTEPFGGCEGSTIYHPSSDLLLFTNPNVPAWNIHRFNLGLHTSADNGATWTHNMTIWPYACGYTSMIIMPDDSVSLIFEKANQTALIQEPQTLTFVSSFWRP